MPIHKEPERCPVCGYALDKANEIFGFGEVEFTRVVDAAGALTHRERMSLIRFLEKLERNLPPIVLCVYITDYGHLKEFRKHAHWILNQAHIHHPSFGKRERRKAVEDAAIVERKPGEQPRPVQDDEPWWMRWFWTPLMDWLRPVPPPVQKEWMLILVLDVQLEIACFSWGYMLDSYVNPDTINVGITKARIHFRERPMVSALKRVMKATVKNLLARARKKKTEIRNEQKAGHIARLLTAATGICLLGGAPDAAATPAFTNDDFAEVVDIPTNTAPADADSALKDDDYAEVVSPPPAPQPTHTPTAGTRGGAATYRENPRWSSQDHELLMQRKIDAGFNMLIPGAKEVTTPPLPKLKANTGAFEESDTEVRGRYTEEYRPRPGRRVPDFNDPQMILTDVERNDACYRLEELNAHSPFRICVAIFKAGQRVPQGLTAPTLVHTVTNVEEYAVLIQYGMGEQASVDLGYKSIQLTDEQRLKFLQEAQQAVQTAGGGIEGLLAAMKCVKGQIMPLASAFTPLTAGTGYKLDKKALPNQTEETEKKEELTGLKKIHAQIMAPELQPYYVTAGIVLIPVGILFGIISFFRRRCKLLPTTPDIRLLSDYGASVSRQVRYLEGDEEEQPKCIF